MNSQKTTPGSIAAMLAGMAAVVTPSIPAQWQWVGQALAGVLATFATYHP